jgi:hypothetical protein
MRAIVMCAAGLIVGFVIGALGHFLLFAAFSWLSPYGAWPDVSRQNLIVFSSLSIPAAINGGFGATPDRRPIRRRWQIVVVPAAFFLATMALADATSYTLPLATEVAVFAWVAGRVGQMIDGTPLAKPA